MEPAEKPDKKPKPEVGFEKLFDELRVVLSDLTPAEKPEEDVSNQPAIGNDIPYSIADDKESERLGEAAFQSAQSEPVSSDADFWNGNVLGWPDSFKSAMGDETPVDPLSSPATPPEDPLLNLEPFGATQAPTTTPAPPPAVSPSDDWLVRSGKKPSVDPASIPPPPPSGEVDIFVPPPTPPTESHEVVVHDYGVPADNDDLESNDIQLADLEIGVPGSIEKKDKAPVPMTPSTMATNTHLKVAVMFPDGQELKAKEFVMNLKSTATRGTKQLNIDSIFSHAWFAGQIDVVAWKKAATLSGADFLYILAPKKDKELFLSIASSVKDGIRSRLVLMEHLAMKTLYADLLFDLSRNVHGKT